MDEVNHLVLPGTAQEVPVSLEEENEKKLYPQPGGLGSSSLGEPDLLGENQCPVDERTAGDGADLTAAYDPGAPLGIDRTDQPYPHRCSDESNVDDRRDECPICNERFGASGDHRVALLLCDHAICHHCLSHILRSSRDPSRVQCPFCRQNTPLSRRDFAQMMLEKAYNDSNDGARSAFASTYSSAPLLADVQPMDPRATPQAALGGSFAPGSEQLGVWAGGGGGDGGGASGSWVGLMRRPACCLPSTTVLLLLLLGLPWLFMSLRYL